MLSLIVQFRAIITKREYTMDQKETKRFDKLYQRHLQKLKLQGKSEKTRDAYARAIRRLRDHFDCCPDKFKAFNAIMACRTIESGQVAVSCPHCLHVELKPLSCCNRNCPKCQNHNTSQWINRQINKLLPVRYFMVTFTLPFQFRTLARRYQKRIYSLSFYPSPAFSRISD